MTSTKHSSPSLLGEFVFCPNASLMRKNGKSTYNPDLEKGKQFHRYFKLFLDTLTTKIQNYGGRDMKPREFVVLIERSLELISESCKEEVGDNSGIADVITDFLSRFTDYLRERTLSMFPNFTEQYGGSMFLENLFGGIPRTEVSLKGRGIARADILIEGDSSISVGEFKSTGNIPGKDEEPESHIVQLSATAMIAEESLGKPCNHMFMVYRDGIFRKKQLTDALRQRVWDINQKITNLIQFDEKLLFQSKCFTCGYFSICQNEKIGEEKQYLGSVVQTAKKALILNIGDPQKNVLEGYGFSKHANKLQEHLILVVEGKINRLFCNLIEIRGWQDSTSLPDGSKATSGYISLLKLNPFLGITPQGIPRTIPNENYSGCELRPPTIEELRSVYRIPREGVPFGIITSQKIYDELPASCIPYFFPLEKMGYRSVLILGQPGKGKTNFLKVLIAGCSHYLGGGQQPAIIVFDPQGQFGDLNRLAKHVPPISKKIWEIIGLQPCAGVNHYEIGTQNMPGIYSIPFKDLSLSKLRYLLPELPTKSMAFFDLMIQKLQHQEFATYEDFLDAVSTELEENEIIHKTQRSALLRASHLGPRAIFDAKGEKLKIQELLKPGVISVLDVGLLKKQEKRLILLYIMLQLEELKMERIQEKTPPVLLVVDEAFHLFPSKSSSAQDKEFLDRTVEQVLSITKLGRKKRYGIIFATQEPEDIDGRITADCQTHIYFGLSPKSKRWLDESLGITLAKRVREFETGYALVKSIELHKNAVQIYVPIAPNAHEEG